MFHEQFQQNMQYICARIYIFLINKKTVLLILLGGVSVVAIEVILKSQCYFYT